MPAPGDLVDRQYVSRFSQPKFGITVYVDGVLGDADSVPTVTYMHPDPDSSSGEATTWTRDATRESLGVYSITLSSVETATPEVASLLWDYQTSGIDQVYGIDIEIGLNAPDYDALTLPWRQVVENVWLKFADIFDSPYGGPNLQVYVQTHFGRNRLAQLLPQALQVLNSAASPHATFPMNGQNFPFPQWGLLLSQSLYIEVIKHLIRSYVEQPETVLGTSVSRLDRRDYMDRWRSMLDIETQQFNQDLSRFRMDNISFTSSVLVAGGVFGNIDSGYFPGPGEAAARGYFYPRYH